MTNQDIVGKPWNLRNALEDGGVTCPQYVTERTDLLLLKMAEWTGQQVQVPAGNRWAA